VTKDDWFATRSEGGGEGPQEKAIAVEWGRWKDLRAVKTKI